MRITHGCLMFFAVIGIVTCGGLVSPVQAKDPINATFIGKRAIEGFDPVAYFTQHQAVQGTKNFVYEWKGAQWLFATAENRDLFKAAPDKYAPQYGGYCAYAVAKGRTAPIDPQVWTIVNDKLYLNYSAEIFKKWKDGMTSYIQKADQNWPGVLK